MKMSKLFTKSIKDYPKDEVSASSQLLIRGGFIDKVTSGVYTILPLGVRVVEKISAIIRFEMENIDGQEVYMPALVPKENLEITGRWSGLDILFKIEDQNEKQYGLGATHEEIVAPLAKKFALSYRDLPFSVFQIQNKFRNELRAKSGVLRTREFLMKDMYSFHTNEDDLAQYHDRVAQSYWKIFERVGIKEKTHIVMASGGTFSKYSYEFQTETEFGEDDIYLCKSCGCAVNREIVEDRFDCPQCHFKEYEIKKMIEVGNIFKLGENYSRPFDLKYVNESGKSNFVQMGCYGIGIQRLMGAICEVNHDENGLIWPTEVAPFRVHLIFLGNASKKAESLYKELKGKGVEVLFDDRSVSAGEKFADADLIGIPFRVVVSDKTGDNYELKKRSQQEVSIIDLDTLLGEIG